MLLPPASIPSPTAGVYFLGPVPLRGYALCIVAGIVLAVWITDRRLVARGEAIGGEEAERLDAQARGGAAGITSAEISSSEDDFPASGPKNSRSPQM